MSERTSSQRSLETYTESTSQMREGEMEQSVLEKSLPRWAKSSIEEACSSGVWKTILERVHASVAKNCKTQGIDSFANLSQKEQAAVIEREFSDLQESRDPLLMDFSSTLNTAMDENLIEFLSTKTDQEKQKLSSVAHLSRICSETVETLLKRAPPEMATTAKLFLNRPLPVYIRKKIWAMLLKTEMIELEALPGRLAPSTEVLVSRRILTLLDKHFASFSSRANAAVIKNMISNYMRALSIPLPHNEDSFDVLDKLFFLILPVALVFNHKDDEDNFLEKVLEQEYAGHWDEKNVKERETERALRSVTLPRHLGLIDESGSFLMHSPYLSFTTALLEQKNRALAAKLTSLYGGPGEEYASEIFGNLTGTAGFQDALDACLMRGLSGLLPVDTVLFVWDQGVIGKFDSMLPTILTAVVLGAAEELLSVTQLSSALDIFASYCCSITVQQLQLLLTKHCRAELNEVFEVQGCYVLGINEEGILRAVYPKLMPDGMFDDPGFSPTTTGDTSTQMSTNTSTKSLSKADSLEGLSVEERVRRTTGFALRSL